MSCTVPQERVDACIDFHGHVCPGLSIGIRAAEYCLERFGHNDTEPICAVCETDMCGVDAIQFLTGCTFGKGNLIHRDWGKTAFTFYSRKDGAGERIRLKPGALGAEHEQARELMRLDVSEGLDAAGRARLAGLRVAQQRRMMELPLEELFETSSPQRPMPRGPMIMDSLGCAGCGEPVMESRVRMLGGEPYCIPCFGEREQKR